MDIKTLLKERRIELGLTMKQVADKVGVSESTVSRWESGDIANMTRDKVLALANALRLSPAAVMGWNEEKPLARSGDAVARHVMILCFTGWRIQEYCNLTVFDYDREAHTLKGGLKTDAGRDRLVPVPERVHGYVEDFFSRSERLCAMNVKQFRAAFYDLLDRLGIQSADGDKKITPHSTRHTYNSMLAKQGVSVEIRMKLMGQVSEDVNRKVYTHTEVEELTRAVSGL